MKEIDPIATLYYAVVPSEEGYDNGILCGRLEVEIDGWIGLGFSPSGSMANSQAVIGIPDEDTVQKYDLATGRATPMTDDRQTLRDTSIEIVDGKTTMSFTKLLVEDGEVTTEEEGDNTFLFAWGGSSLGYHMSRKAFTIDLGSTSTAQTDSPQTDSPTPVEAVETESPTLPPVEAVETKSPTSTLTNSPTPSPTKITPSPTYKQVAPGPAPEVSFISFGKSVTISCLDDGSKCCVPDYFASFDNTGDMDVDISDDNACSSKSSGGTLNECQYEMSCIVTCDPGCSLIEVVAQAEAKETSSPTPSPDDKEGSTVYNAEDATFEDVEVKTENEGYTGTGYADMGDKGSYIEFTNVESKGGGCSLSFRYAFGDNENRPVEVMVNDEVVGTLDLLPTGDWEDWQDSEAVEAQCVEGSNNIRIVVSTDAGGPNVDSLKVTMSSTAEDSNSNIEAVETESPTLPPIEAIKTESPMPPVEAVETNSPTVTEVVETEPPVSVVTSPSSDDTEEQTTYQAGDATFDDVELAGKNEGYTGTGYADMGDKGSYIEFTNVESTGGSCSVTIRYAFDNNKNRPVEVMVNSEVVGTLDLSSTGDWELWQDSEAVEAQCLEGSNVIRIVASTDAGGPNVDSLTIMPSAGEDEDSDSTTEPTSLSTDTLTSSPTNTPSVSPVTESPSSSPIEATPSPTVSQVDTTTTTTAATEQAVVDPWEDEYWEEYTNLEYTNITLSPSSALFSLEGDFPTEAPGDMTSRSPTQPSNWWQDQEEPDGSDSSKAPFNRSCSLSLVVALAMFVVSCIGM